jgi:hypothetical protein
MHENLGNKSKQIKAVPLYNMEALGGRADIAPNRS